MIQRIQTFYLLVIVALFVGVLYFPLAVIQSGSQFYTFDIAGLKTMPGEPEIVYSTWSLFALAAIIILIALITVFLFKNRILQIRLSVFNAILMLGFYGLFLFFVYTIKSQIDVTHLSIKFALALPVIAMIMDYLAIRNIGADEALVRSLNRLR